VKCEQLGSERFIISHGSWQQRYKISITPEGRIRWTVKTNTGVADLDCSSPIDLNRYYHITVLYTGFSMELYIDGVLDTFKAFTGAIQASTKPITIGRMDNIETQYALPGSVDEFKLWNVEIPATQIEQLKNQWPTVVRNLNGDQIERIYPNPAERQINIELKGSVEPEDISIFTGTGVEVQDFQIQIQGSNVHIEIPPSRSGIYILKIILKDGKLVTRKVVISQN
jgi:hypothetical protein